MYCRAGSRKRVLAGDVPRWVANSKRKKYILAVILSTPDWVNRGELWALARTAARLTKLTGNLHTLDHIIPLNHPRVCGLTVPWNLRVMPWAANCSKGNTWCPEQEELFPPLAGQGELFSE